MLDDPKDVRLAELLCFNMPPTEPFGHSLQVMHFVEGELKARALHHEYAKTLFLAVNIRDPQNFSDTLGDIFRCVHATPEQRRDAAIAVLEAKAGG